MSLIITLLKELKVAKVSFTLGIFLLLIATAAGQLAPLLLKEIIDKQLTPVADGLQINHHLFYQFIFYYFAVTLLTAIFRYISFRTLIYSSNKVVSHLRKKAFNIMQSLPISYFDKVPAGKIATRIVNDTETLRNQFYDNLLSQIIISFVQIVFIYGVMIYLDHRSGIWLLIVIPLFYGIQLLYKAMTDKHMTDFYQARSTINTQVNETMNGAQIIQLYHQEEAVLDEFNQTIQEMKTADDHIIVADSVASWTLTEFVKYTIISALLAVIGYQFLQGYTDVTVGKLFIYINYLTRLFDLLGNMVRQLPNIQRSTATGKRLMALLDEETESEESEPINISNGQVVFQGVDFAYTPDRLVLSNITITANKGETVALVGHTGSGKSSIMNLLYRFYDPIKGDILVDNQSIQHYSKESLRSQMGIVLQDPYLFTGTIASNIRMGNDNYSDQQVEDALIKVGAKKMLEQLPHGINEPVYEKGASFSSGERQLIAFARTLIANPKILILDEATSHIDTETEEIIQHAMQVLKEGRTTFIIAHRLSTIQFANQILVLDKGKIVEQGNHHYLMSLNGKYTQLAKLQERV
ncbi:ABC transporter ATP-binding protein [Streptococcus hongkongensis]|nr:ABC transporter ATP-binding protein [Streptococcus uberis]